MTPESDGIFSIEQAQEQHTLKSRKSGRLELKVTDIVR